jgi:hypothetical protein
VTGTCPHDAADVAARYARGEAGPGIDEFEVHLLTCDACQSLVRLSASVVAASNVARAPAKGRIAIVATAAVAAAALIIALTGRRDPLGRFELAGGGFEPVRSAGVATADSGLAALSEGNAHAAVALLSRAFAGDSSPGLAFFLATSQLLADDPAEAIATLDAVADDDLGPYALDAAYIRAKAWVRSGHRDSALAALAPLPVTAGSGESHGDRAAARNRAFADSIRLAGRRCAPTTFRTPR